jgi:hypothetical protein
MTSSPFREFAAGPGRTRAWRGGSGLGQARLGPERPGVAGQGHEGHGGAR